MRARAGGEGTHEEQDESEAEAEEDGAGEIGVVHDALVGFREWVEDGEGFGEDVRGVDAQLWMMRKEGRKEMICSQYTTRPSGTRYETTRRWR